MALTDEDFMTIKELGDKWPYEWVSTKGLAPYVKRLGDNVVGIEIGTCRAESTAYLLEKCPNIDRIFTVDPYKAYDDWNGEITQETVDRFRDIAIKNLEPYGDRYRMIREPSSEAASNFTDTLVDFIFVDGDHSYEATLNDCEKYYPFLKKGGLFCGHDYSSIEAVYKAVNDFREKNKISSPINLSSNSTFFWYK
jgi:predicted O-methyltransferase YrrM